MINNQKKCNKCNYTKNFSEFHRSNTTKDGRVYSCKKCLSTKSKNKYIKKQRVTKQIPAGTIFNYWKVIKEAKRRITKRYFVCSCVCGTTKEISMSGLTTGHSKSCRQCGTKRRPNYGLSQTREYHCWESMKQRCNNPKNPRYKDYGGRGISMCKEWENSFELFYLDIGIIPDGMSIDRIDNDKGYNNKNCKLSTPREQMLNTRRSVKTNNHAKK